MIETLKELWPIFLVVIGWGVLVERRLSRIEGKLSLICKHFNPEKGD